MPTARALIAALDLAPLPGEGGYFRATWRSDTASAILFLLTQDTFAAWHRLDRDELWHFHGGRPVELFQLDPLQGAVRASRLGADVLQGDTPQLHVPAGVWQAARLVPDGDPDCDYALVGCTVSPPWDQRGFELGNRAELTQAFPDAATLIRALTR